MTFGAGTLSVGLECRPLTDHPLTVTDFVRYQGASGDMNPIHHDSEFAARLGFTTPLAVGMLQAGVLGTYVTDWLGARNLRRFAVRFIHQMFPGDVLTYRAVIAAIREDADETLIDLDLSVTNADDVVHIKGTATFVAPTDSTDR